MAFDSSAYSPGDTVRVSVTRKGKPIKVRDVVVELACFERKRRKERRTMDSYDYAREHELGLPKTTHIETTVVEETERRFYQKKTFDGMEYGDVTLEAAFVLPSNAPPTSREFGHDDTIHIWKVYVKFDVPFGLDENAQKEFFVSGL